MKLLVLLAAVLGSTKAQCSWSLNSDKGHNEIWYSGGDGDAKAGFTKTSNVWKHFQGRALDRK